MADHEERPDPEQMSKDELVAEIKHLWKRIDDDTDAFRLMRDKTARNVGLLKEQIAMQEEVIHLLEKQHGRVGHEFRTYNPLRDDDEASNDGLELVVEGEPMKEMDLGSAAHRPAFDPKIIPPDRGERESAVKKSKNTRKIVKTPEYRPAKTPPSPTRNKKREHPAIKLAHPPLNLE